MNHKTLMAQDPVDVNVSHKTGWFPRYVTPVRTGWYQGNFDRFWYWDGKNWNKHGYITGIFGVVKGPDAWRGLTANNQVEGAEGCLQPQAPSPTPGWPALEMTNEQRNTTDRRRAGCNA